MAGPRDSTANLSLRQIDQQCEGSVSQNTYAGVPGSQDLVAPSEMAKNEDRVIQMDPEDPHTRYSIRQKIAEGAFGIVFAAHRLFDNRKMAIKFELRGSDSPQLRDEYRTYRVLNGCDWAPKAYSFGRVHFHDVLVLDLLGQSLEDLFDRCGRKFTFETVAMIADQLLRIFQELHEKNLIYRDVKPENFLVGLPESGAANTIHLVDFGMASSYRDAKTLQHKPFREGRSLAGTPRYMSKNVHLGHEPSRRDDLEALGNVLIYFLQGRLPWQGIKAATKKERCDKIGIMKQEISVDALCGGFDMIHQYFHYVHSLGFESDPDYDYLRELFTTALGDVGDINDRGFDWQTLEPLT